MCQIADTRAALLCLVSIRKAANLFRCFMKVRQKEGCFGE